MRLIMLGLIIILLFAVSARAENIVQPEIKDAELESYNSGPDVIAFYWVNGKKSEILPNENIEDVLKMQGFQMMVYDWHAVKKSTPVIDEATFTVVTPKSKEVIAWTDCPDEDMDEERCLEHFLEKKRFLPIVAL